MTDASRSSNPFPGLRPFRTDEDYLFFGREAQTAELLTLLRKHRFLAIVGTSGSGKSSLVRAGLLPELQGGTMNVAGSVWEVAVLRPGGDPMANLARGIRDADIYDAGDVETLPRLVATLRHSGLGLVEAYRQSEIETGANLLVVVDQFEELFRFQHNDTESRDEAKAFVSVLLEASRQKELPVYIVLTMRSDYLGDCSEFRGLAEAVNEGEYLIPRLGREQLRAAIEGPVRVGGGEIAGRLVQHLLNDVGDDPDQLPILQHALMRTWDHWVEARSGDEPIDLGHYEGIGGMREALSRHADEVQESLPDDHHRRVAERVFKALTEKGTDNRGIRRPTRLGDLVRITAATTDEVRTVADAYRRPGVTFLMPGTGRELLGDTVVDLSHESLMRVWQRLSAWVEEESQSARIYRRLSETAALWRHGRAGLYRDPDLQIARSWREEREPNEAWAEQYGGGFTEAMAFLDRSRDVAEEAEREKEAARLRELEQARALLEARERAARNFKRFAAGMGILALIALVLSVWAFTLKERAEESERRADSEALAAQAARKEAEDLLVLARHEQGKTWLERARFLLREKRHLDAKLMAAMAVGFEGFGRSARDDAFRERRLVLLKPDSPEWLEVERMVRLEPDYPVIWRSPTRRHHLHPAGVSSGLEFSPDGSILASTRETIRLWDTTTGDEIGTLDGHDGNAETLKFSPVGGLLASGGQDGTVRLWDVASRKETAKLEGHSAAVFGVDFSPDGAVLASGGGDRTVRLWSVADRREIGVLEGHTGAVRELAFSPVGSLLASAGNDSVVRLWDVSTRTAIGQLAGGGRLVWVAFSPDGALVAASSYDSNAYVWDVASRDRIATLSHPGPVSSLRFGRSGAVLATSVVYVPGSNPRSVSSVRFWDLASQKKIAAFAPGAETEGLCFRPDGAVLATGETGGAIRLWKVPPAGEDSAPEEVAPLRDGHSGAVLCVAFSADGTVFASGGDDGVILWDAATGTAAARWGNDYRGSVRDLAFSPDGVLVASCVYDTRARSGEIRLQDFRRGEEAGILRGTGSTQALAFEPDGKFLASGGSAGGDAGAVLLWDVSKGERLAQILLGPGVIRRVSVSPDGATVAAGSSTGDVRLVDVARREQIATLEGHTGSVLGVEFSPDGALIASCSGDGSVLLWDAITHEEVAALARQGGAVNGIRFSPNGALLATCGETVMLWDTSGRRLIAAQAEQEAGVEDLAFAPDGATLASASADGSVRLLDVSTPGVAAIELSRPVSRVALSPDGFTLAASTAEGALHLVDVLGAAELVHLEGHSRPVGDLSFSPDGSLLASASWDRTARLWDVATGALLTTFEGYQDWATSVSFSPDGARLLSASDDRLIRLWDVATGDLLGTFVGHTHFVRAAVFSPDGRTVASGGFDRTVRLWDVDGRRELARLEGHERPVKRVSFSPDGALLASCDDRTIRIWDVPERKEIGMIEAPGALDSVMFHPGGALLATCGDGLRLWDVASRREVSTLAGHAAQVRGMDFNADGTLLATAGDDRFVRLWNPDPPDKDLSRYASYLDWYEIAGREIRPKRKANLRRPTRRDLDPTASGSHISILGRDASRAEIDRALFQAYYRARNWRSAARLLGNLDRGASGDERRLLVEALLRDAAGLSERGLSGLAARHIDLAEEVGGASPRSWALRAAVFHRLDKPDQASAAFERGIELATSRGEAGHPALYDVASRRFRYHLERKDMDGARDDFEILTRLAQLPRGTSRERLLRSYTSARAERALAAAEAGELEAARPELVLAALTEIQLEAAGSGDIDVDSLKQLEPLLAEARQARPNVTLVPRDAEWRYLDDGSDPGPSFFEVDFDDGAWGAGPAPLGFGDGRETTRIRRNAENHQAGDSYVTFYFRHRFELRELPEARRLELGVARDDGVVVYLNGREILRDNLPAGPIGHDTLASAVTGGADETRFHVFLVDGSLLRQGANVLVAEVHQSTRSSSDVHFEASLEATPVSVASYLAGLDAVWLDRVLAGAESFLPPSLAAEWLGPMRFAWSRSPDVVGEVSKDPASWRLRRRIREALGDREAVRLAAEAEIALLDAGGWPVGDHQRALELARSLRRAGASPRAVELLLARLGAGPAASTELLKLLVDISLNDLGRTPEEVSALLPKDPRIPWGALGGQAIWSHRELETTGAVRINCGGGAYTSPEGVFWGPDRFFTAGEVYSSGAYAGEIAGTEDDPLYQTERWVRIAAGSTEPSLYRVPLPPGSYRVTLYFAEIWEPFGKKGLRVFDVELEGERVIEDYDISAAKGVAAADTKEFDVDVKDGFLDVGATARVEHPKFAAIEIVRVD